MKKFIIVANFTNDADIFSCRFFYIANLLSSSYEVEVITSDFAHDLKSFKTPWKGEYAFKVTYIHEPGYPTNVCLKRLYSHWIWGKNVAKYLKSIAKPDYIYCAVPSLTAALEAGRYSKKFGAQFIIDIQDLWPEAFGMVMGASTLKKIALYPIKIYADAIYKRADKVIGVSDTYRDRGLLVNKSAKGLSVYLGNNGAVFDEAKKTYSESYDDNELRIAYIGTLGHSYDIQCVIDAVALVNSRKNIEQQVKFIVMGDGPFRSKFEAYAKTRNANVVFTGRLPYQQMVGKMCSCDIVVNPIVKGAAQSITNKVGDFALSGLPVINTQECDEYRRAVANRALGINCECGNVEEVAYAIESLALNPTLRKEMGDANRRFGEECFDRRNTYPKIISFIEQ
jgi:glycosyltransferase involved in cell wall biosynthesis